MRISGGCHCGAISYEAEIDPDSVAICHCTDCQTLSGSAFRVVVPAKSAGFKLLAGEPKIYVKTAESGNRRAQAFCGECGSRLWASAEKDPPLYNLRVGALRERAELRPRVQLWCRSSMPWVDELVALPKFQKGSG